MLASYGVAISWPDKPVINKSRQIPTGIQSRLKSLLLLMLSQSTLSDNPLTSTKPAYLHVG